MHRVIEATSNEMQSNRAAAKRELAIRLDCAASNKRLDIQRDQLAGDLADTSSKYAILQRQFHEAKVAYRSTVEDYECRFRNYDKIAEQEAARAAQLESTIRPAMLKSCRKTRLLLLLVLISSLLLSRKWRPWQRTTKLR